MVRNILRLIMSLIILFSISSCSRLMEGSTILAGNQKFRSGSYQGAIIDYLKGVNSVINKDYFYYNLGNVYSSLGEYPSAFSVWNLADGIEDYQLMFNLLFNKGFLEYQEGHYKEAYDLYRQALVLMPGNIKAKINLELSLNKMSAATHNQTKTEKKKDLKGASDETVRILEYVKQKEAMTWGLEQQDQEFENDW